MALRFENPSPQERQLIKAANRRHRIADWLGVGYFLGSGLIGWIVNVSLIVFVGYWVCRAAGCIPE